MPYVARDDPARRDGELDVPLIGFAGAPFTLASYLVEGGPSRDHARTKALMLGDPAAWDALMRALVAIVVPHLRAQVGRRGERAAGVRLVGRGARARGVRAARAAAHARGCSTGSPTSTCRSIHFGVGTGELLAAMARAGGDAIGVDHRVPLDAAWDRIGGPGARADPGEPRPGRAAGARGRSWSARRSTCSHAPAAATATSSTSGTACCRPPTPTSLRRLVDLVHERTERAAA